MRPANTLLGGEEKQNHNETRLGVTTRVSSKPGTEMADSVKELLK
jgi:hypothetical protein